IELEHGGVKLQHILRSDLGGARRLGADDRLEVGRHFGGARWRAIFDGCQSRKDQADAADDYRSMFHEFLPCEKWRPASDDAARAVWPRKVFLRARPNISQAGG